MQYIDIPAIKVSVVMAVFNEQNHLEAALDSVLGQGIDLEFVVVDDCSTDRTPDILARYQKANKCIVVIRNEKNLGLAASLNIALKRCHGDFIARMDADDISKPGRLLAQTNFLTAHPEIDVLGGNAQLIGPEGVKLAITDLPLTQEAIRKSIVRICPIIHPSVMYRSSFVKRFEGYDTNLKRCQDYDLWLRSIDSSRFANMPDVLIDYRVSNSSTFKNDMYAFYVRLTNSWRRKALVQGVFWAIVILGVNLARKLGYVQRLHRVKGE